MTEEAKQAAAAEPSANADADDSKGEISASEVRKHKVFQAVTKQLNEMQSKLSEYERERTETAKRLELEKAKADQTLEAIVKDREAKIEQLEKQFGSYRTEQALRLEAARHGVTNDLLLEGVVAKFKGLQEPPEDIAAWVRSLTESEDYAPLLGRGPQRTQVASTGPTSRVAGRSNGEYGDLLSRWASGDTSTISQVAQLRREGRITSEQLAAAKGKKQ